MTLKELIKIASSAYNEGLIEQYHNQPSGDHGDLLAKFIAQELAETYDHRESSLDQLSRAMLVMATASNQLSEVYDALDDEMELVEIDKQTKAELEETHE